MNTLIESFNWSGAQLVQFAKPMIIQTVALTAIVATVDILLRKRVRAAFRYGLWMLVLVKLVIPPTLTLPTSVAYWFPKEPGETPRMVAMADATTASFASSTEGVPAAAQTAQAATALDGAGLLFLIWMSVAAILALGVARNFWRAYRLVNDTAPAPGSAVELLEECREMLGLKQVVQLRANRMPVSPAVFGMVRPVIIVSSELLEKLTQPELKSILLHELAHVKRRDLWVNHVQILLQVTFWFNPAMWFANAMVRRVREQAVDELVLVEMKEEAEVYPSTLVQVAKLALESPAMRMGFVGILQNGNPLSERIRHIINQPVPTSARIGFRGLALIGLIGVLVLPMGRLTVAAEKNTKVIADSISEVMSGRKLTAEEAKELEAMLRENPDAVEARRKLLGYYRGNESREARRRHVLWFIEHRPESEIHKNFGSLLAQIDGEAFEKGKDLWLEHVEKQPKNAKILGNAAKYLLLSDQERAERLLKQAKELQPDNSQWAWELAQLYQLKGRFAEPGTKEELMKKALSEMKAAQAMTTEEMARFYNLDYLSSMAFSAGELEQAKEYAEKFLQQAELYPDDWASGNAVHNGNIILGRIALRKGNVAEAAKHLLAAGKSEGSPQLNSFGPSMILAKELLEKGQNEAVLEYLDSVGSFWKSGADQLDRWKKLIKAGVDPDFGTNLR